MTLARALAMAGSTTWASHSREQVDAAVSVLAAEVGRLRRVDAEVAMLRASQRAADDRAQMRSDERDRAMAENAILREKAWKYDELCK